jgi:hypothetical protein
MQSDCTVNFFIFQITRKCSIAAGIMMEYRLHFIIPGTWNAGKFLDATPNLDVFMVAVQVFQACRNMWGN